MGYGGIKGFLDFGKMRVRAALMASLVCSTDRKVSDFRESNIAGRLCKNCTSASESPAIAMPPTAARRVIGSCGIAACCRCACSDFRKSSICCFSARVASSCRCSGGACGSSCGSGCGAAGDLSTAGACASSAGTGGTSGAASAFKSWTAPPSRNACRYFVLVLILRPVGPRSASRVAHVTLPHKLFENCLPAEL